MSQWLSRWWDITGWRNDVLRGRDTLVAPVAGVAGHNHRGSNRPERPLHDGARLFVRPSASNRSCRAGRLRWSILVHRRSGAMGITSGTKQGSAETRHRRERATANSELTISVSP